MSVPEELTTPQGFDSSEKLKKHLQTARTVLNLPADVPVSIGIGFIGWLLDKTEISDDPRIERVLEERPVAVWFAFGVDLGKYVAKVKAYDAKREIKHKTLIFVIVNSVDQAVRAANDWGVDVLVVQGILSGRL